ncbi:hypothetical protein AB835_03800 [Candidatus Endobugula sertula]|uniref:Polypeptide-transport-associated ShlB-type domain-containing protein n=1 Tax=Candidatus Endobugula sertula TaxID=62101 RepID=A0A1D2QS72_9GAMM|nr:hypothetical protein AB835_03800 [Candidatus Endobugula sertula]
MSANCLYPIIGLWLMVLLSLPGTTAADNITLAEGLPETVWVETIVLEGHTVFSDAQLAPLITPYQQRQLSADDLHQLTQALTAFYIHHGYINSGVVIDPQSLNDGVLRLRAIEGRLTALTIEGNGRLRAGYIGQRIAPELIAPELKSRPGTVLNAQQLQNRLRLLEQNPRIEQLHAELTPGIEPGEAELTVAVEKAQPYYVEVKLNNYVSPNVGSWQGQLSTGHLNVTGWKHCKWIMAYRWVIGALSSRSTIAKVDPR